MELTKSREQVSKYKCKMKHYFCTLILLVSVFITNNIFAVEKAIVRVAMSLTPLSSPFIIAKEKGYFKELGLEVEIIKVKGGNLALKTVFDGHADIATSSEAVVMFNSSHQNAQHQYHTWSPHRQLPSPQTFWPEPYLDQNKHLYHILQTNQDADDKHALLLI